MKITKRGVALSAMSLMSGAALLLPQNASDAAAVTANLEVRATVVSLVALTLETTTEAANAPALLSRDVDGSTANDFTGTLDFGTVDALGNDNSHIAGYFQPAYGENNPGTPVPGTITAAGIGYYTLRSDASGEIHADGDQNVAYGSGGAGGLYVIGGKVNDGIAGNGASTGGNPAGAIRHRAFLTGGARAKLELDLNETVNPFDSATDAIIPVFVSKADSSTATPAAATAFVDAATLPAAWSSDANYNGTGSIVAIGSVAAGATSTVNVGTWFGRTDMGGANGGRYLHDEWDTLTYAILVTPAESAGAKSTMVRYTLTPVP